MPSTFLHLSTLSILSHAPHASSSFQYFFSSHSLLIRHSISHLTLIHFTYITLIIITLFIISTKTPFSIHLSSSSLRPLMFTSHLRAVLIFYSNPHTTRQFLYLTPFTVSSYIRLVSYLLSYSRPALFLLPLPDHSHFILFTSFHSTLITSLSSFLTISIIPSFSTLSLFSSHFISSSPSFCPHPYILDIPFHFFSPYFHHQLHLPSIPTRSSSSSIFFNISFYFTSTLLSVTLHFSTSSSSFTIHQVFSFTHHFLTIHSLSLSQHFTPLIPHSHLDIFFPSPVHSTFRPSLITSHFSLHFIILPYTFLQSISPLIFLPRLIFSHHSLFHHYFIFFLFHSSSHFSFYSLHHSQVSHPAHFHSPSTTFLTFLSHLSLPHFFRFSPLISFSHILLVFTSIHHHFSNSSHRSILSLLAFHSSSTPLQSLTHYILSIPHHSRLFSIIFLTSTPFPSFISSTLVTTLLLDSLLHPFPLSFSIHFFSRHHSSSSPPLSLPSNLSPFRFYHFHLIPFIRRHSFKFLHFISFSLLTLLYFPFSPTSPFSLSSLLLQFISFFFHFIHHLHLHLSFFLFHFYFTSFFYIPLIISLNGRHHHSTPLFFLIITFISFLHFRFSHIIFFFSLSTILLFTLTTIHFPSSYILSPLMLEWQPS